MADAYWRYDDRRQQPPLPNLVAKRPRSDYDLPGGHELPSYYVRDDERAGLHLIRDTDTIGASYDRYLRNAQISSYGGSDSARPLGGGLSGRPVDDPRIIGLGGSDPVVTTKSRSMGLGGGRPEISLPPDASNTLFVEGLPTNCTRREVSHIFRPFVGYKEVRLVTKESRHVGGEPLVLCFVDFVSPAHAATAMDALQGVNNVNIWLRSFAAI
ncbi:protein MATERNALLY EXPRESSED GENE 5-like isoform X2 [Diospyros lotus]|uniref:protein MATERNALLY EXPRESSED GENE 5-like isoform X2 n=1 Tax=Diospyros lotus TaxID=55363 RepID=UPI0022517C5A|nr:protein MATERNALLY EXPRESSED GENE 5-like isoform X2 [Diospyros lotus]